MSYLMAVGQSVFNLKPKCKLSQTHKLKQQHWILSQKAAAGSQALSVRSPPAIAYWQSFMHIFNPVVLKKCPGILQRMVTELKHFIPAEMQNRIFLVFTVKMTSYTKQKFTVKIKNHFVLLK